MYTFTTGICTTGSVQTITITGGGSGYTSAYIVTITGSGALTITYNQFDSTFKTFDSTQHEFDDDRVFNPQLVGALEFLLSVVLGIVTGAYIINGGCGYTEVPEVTFAEPTVVGFGTTVGIGTFAFNEIVIGQSSRTTACQTVHKIFNGT